MKVTFDPSVPIYTQIVDRFRREICSGARQPGERIEPVRELAGTLGVNPNTLQRALGELEREGLVSWEELFEQLDSDFSDERIRGIMQSAPRYCEGNSSGDYWAKRLTESFSRIICAVRMPKGRRLIPGWFSWARTIAHATQSPVRSMPTNRRGRHVAPPCSYSM